MSLKTEHMKREKNKLKDYKTVIRFADEETAVNILKYYGNRTLMDNNFRIPYYKGVRFYWHAYHDTYKIFMLTHKELINRICIIGLYKPIEERKKRFKFFKPVKHYFFGLLLWKWRLNFCLKKYGNIDSKLLIKFQEWSLNYKVESLWTLECPRTIKHWDKTVHNGRLRFDN